LSALESLAAGVPALSHRRSLATVELIEDSQCGATWDSPEELRRLLEKRVAQPDEERVALAERTQEFARERFAWDAVMARVEEALAFAAKGQAPGD
jgi:glycosyltransferase involved in cell wall biosynthesis